MHEMCNGPFALLANSLGPGEVRAIREASRGLRDCIDTCIEIVAIDLTRPGANPSDGDGGAARLLQRLPSVRRLRLAAPPLARTLAAVPAGTRARIEALEVDVRGGPPPALAAAVPEALALPMLVTAHVRGPDPEPDRDGAGTTEGDRQRGAVAAGMLVVQLAAAMAPLAAELHVSRAYLGHARTTRPPTGGLAERIRSLTLHDCGGVCAQFLASFSDLRSLSLHQVQLAWPADGTEVELPRLETLTVSSCYSHRMFTAPQLRKAVLCNVQGLSSIAPLCNQGTGKLCYVRVASCPDVGSLRCLDGAMDESRGCTIVVDTMDTVVEFPLAARGARVRVVHSAICDRRLAGELRWARSISLDSCKVYRDNRPWPDKLTTPQPVGGMAELMAWIGNADERLYTR
jgi:hypothetical protein